MKFIDREYYYNKAIEKAKLEIGKTYNNLTITDIDYEKTYDSYFNKSYHRVFVIIQCKCGKTGISNQLNAIRIGHIKSCGCSKFNNPLCMEDLSGKQFGRLKVIKRDMDRDIQEKDKKHHCVHWLCQCNCGNKNLVSVTTYQLKSGKTQSCGCYASEQIAKRNKKYSTKYNKFIHQEDGTTIIFDDNNNQCLIDTEDFDIVSKWYWRKIEKRGNIDKGYWVTNVKKEDEINKSVLMLHQVIAKIKYKEEYKKANVVDHLSRDTNDNRKCNLFLKTNQKNSHNRGLSKSNTSGKTGVSFKKDGNIWQAYITVNYKTIQLGFFKNFEDAVTARKQAELKYGFTCDENVSEYDIKEDK